MKKFLPFLNKITPIILLILIFCAFFWKFFIKGLIPVAIDIPVAMYYPWLNHSYGYPVHVPVKNPILTDTVSQFWIWRNWAVDTLINKHSISYWNPYSLCGYPQAPWYHTILYSPANIFYLITETAYAMGLIVSSQVMISLLSTYLLFKKIFKSTLGALTTSLSFTFSSFFIGWLTWGTISWSLAFLPLILLALSNLFDSKNRLLNSILLYLSFLFSLLGGHPQTFFLCLVILFIFILVHVNFKNFSANKHLFYILFILFLSLSTASFTLIPSFDILFKSIRNSDNFIQSQSYGLLQPTSLLITTIIPNFFGNPATNNYFGTGINFQERLSWFGTVSLFLSLYSLLKILKNKKYTPINVFLIIIYFTGLLLSIKYPLGFLVYKLNIPLLSTSPAGRSLILTIFAGAILAGLAIHDIYHKQICQLSYRYMLMFYFSFFASVTVALALSFYLYKQASLIYNPTLLINDLTYLKISFRNSILALILSFSIVLPVIPLKLNRFFSLIILGSLTADLFYWSVKYTPFVKPDLFFPSTPSIEFIKKDNSLDFFRVEREKAEILPPNMWQVYGFNSVSGYDPVYPQAYSNYLIDSKLFGDSSRFIELDHSNINQASELGIKYLLVIKRDKSGFASATGKTPYNVDLTKWQSVFEEGAVTVLKNNNFQPPYFFENSDKKIPSTITLSSHTDNTWNFKLTNNQTHNSNFVLLENHDPGNWKALLDGKEVDISLYKNTFKQVIIPPGEHQLSFNYKYIYHDLSLKISAISLTVFTITQLVIFLKKPRSVFTN